MPSDPNEKQFTFAGVPSASTTSAWNFSRHHAPAPFPPLPFRPAARSIATNPRGIPEITTKLSPRVKELDSETLEHMSNDMSAILSDTDVLRIYVALDEMPFALLDALHTDPQSDGHLAELHVCIQTSIRPALGSVSKNLGLERALKHTIRKWNSASTALRFYFLLAQCVDRTERYTFDEHHRVDLSLALDSLARGPAALEAMLSLAEDNARDAQDSPSTYCRDDIKSASEDVMDLDD